MEYIIGALPVFWFLGALVCGFIGQNRRIGFGGAFGISLLFTPWIGVIVTCISPSHEDMKHTENEFNHQWAQTLLLKKIAESKGVPDYEIIEIMKKANLK